MFQKNNAILYVILGLVVFSVLQNTVDFTFVTRLFQNSDTTPQDEDFVFEALAPIQDDYSYVVDANDSLGVEEKRNIEVYNSRNRAVVNITTEILAYNWFFEPVPQEGGVGSGTIIDRRGYILTNHHVIEGANKVFVTFWDKTKVEGSVVGNDIENDLSVLKVETSAVNTEIIPLGNSEALQIGQKVLAIGNPFGLDRTLTTGVVSGLGRPVRSSRNIVIQNMIQTDASINPGNSGGPLLNRRGELVGVNTVIYTPSRGSVGIGFAVPADVAKRVVPDLIRYGQVRRGWIAWQVQPLFRELITYAKLDIMQGLLISLLKNDSNAKKAGLRGGTTQNRVQYGRRIIYLGGDIVTKIGEVEVSSVSDLLEALEQTRPGEKVMVEYYRDKKKRTTQVTLVERPANLFED